MKLKVSTVEVAKKAGVGVSTAGFILSGKAGKMKISKKTEERVLGIAREMGYIPNAVAKSLRSKRSGVVGLLYNHLRHNWADDSLNGIKSVLSEKGYTVFLSTHQFDPELQLREIEMMLQHRFDAIICVPFREGIPAYERVVQSKTPLIFLNDYLDGFTGAHVVAWNAKAAAKRAMQKLLELGRSRIALLTWRNERPMFRARIEAYRECLVGAGLEVREDWVHTFPLKSSVQESVENMFSDPGDRPDAIFAGLDVYGIEAIWVLESMGLKVPQDVALLGMGNQPGSDYPSIGLSSMALPSVAIGKKTGELAIDLIEGESSKPAWMELIDFNELRERRSTQL